MHFHLILLSDSLRDIAYLDPGSGSFILQLLIAGLVGAGFLIKAYWNKLKSLFKRPSDQAGKKGDDTDPKP